MNTAPEALKNTKYCKTNSSEASDKSLSILPLTAFTFLMTEISIDFLTLFI